MMLTPALRRWFTVFLPFALLCAPTPVDGQTPLTLVVGPFGLERGPFVASLGAVAPDLGRAITADVASQVDRMTTYRLVEWDALLDASPLTREHSEEDRAELSCIIGMQLAVVENMDLSLCGVVRVLREGFEIWPVVFTTATGVQCRLPPATVEDRDSAVRHVLAQFDEWEKEVRGTGEPSCG